MHLKQLDIHGFKTFAEKTQVLFTPGITCVIGPNGSGKSNITDAIQWVLGENNVRSLRGSTSQDVIFAGNERRRPLGMAEVSLTIDNSARILPLDFSEITVTRRIYRSGESECLINRVSCRLKDIYELFLDTGIGRDAYSMISQGEIDQILSVRGEDRRAIFEEAAGVKKYRVRKREAERMLEHTQQNLLRVGDIIEEIEQRLGPLQRQASAAKRYRELAGRLRGLEDAWYGSKLRRLNAERARLVQLVAELVEERQRLEREAAAAREAETAARDALRQLDGQAEALRQAETQALQHVAMAEAERVRAEERAGEVRRRLEVLERELAELAERISDQVRRSAEADREEAELKKGVDALRGELAAARKEAEERVAAHEAAAAELERMRQAWLARARRQAELEARVQSQEARLRSLEQAELRAREAVAEAEAERDRLAAEYQQFLESAAEQKQRAGELAGELELRKQEVRTAEQALAAGRSASEAAARAFNGQQARLQALEELGERAEGAAAGAKRLLEASRKGQLPGAWSLLVDALHAPEGLEKAVEAGLGIYADALLCSDEEQALRAVAWLRERKQVALLLPGEPEAEPPLPGSLAERLEGSGPALAWARFLLGRTVLSDSLEAAAAARRAAPDASSPELWVTREGQWLARSGAAGAGVAGVDGSAAAVLARRRELERLKAEAPAQRAAAETARETLREAEGALQSAQAALRESQSRADAARLEHQAALREADRRNGDVQRGAHRAERLRENLAGTERERAGAEETLQRARRDQAATGPEAGDSGSEAELTAGQENVRRLELERRAAENALGDLRVRLAQQEQRLQEAIGAARRAAETGRMLDQRRAERLREQRALTAEREQRTLAFDSLARQVAEADGAVRVAREQLAVLTELRAARTGELDRARAAVSDLDARLRELMGRSHRVEVELTACDSERQHLGREWVEAVLYAEALASSPEEEAEPGPPVTPETLLETWDPREAELVLSSYSDAEAELGRLRRQIRALGAVNPDAVEQFAEARERFEFLTSQRADLEAAQEQLLEAIRELDAASRETFLKAFAEIAAAFDEMFKKLFGGGTTELRLTDPEDVLETGIEIIVQPPGKKQQNLLLLSGGERALTAAAMLFALLRVKPSPFVVLDEVDAALDETNVRRFAEVLREFAEETQFIVVTHNRGTMECGDTLYGVTMEERGISKVLACSLSDPVVARVEAESRPAPAR